MLIQNWPALTLTLILMSTSFGGCLGDRIIPNNENSISISVPIWTKGLFWDYSVKTQEIEASTTMIVAEDSNSTDYSVGTASLMDAKQHRPFSKMRFDNMLKNPWDPKPIAALANFRIMFSIH